MIKGTMRRLIEQKIAQYNKAMDRVDIPQEKTYLSELNGMQQVLETMGIELTFGRDDQYQLTYSIALM